MATELDKALAVVIASVLLWLNQKYGFSLPTDPQILLPIVGAVLAAVVYFVPNKTKAG
jgi:hypothetical protein